MMHLDWYEETRNQTRIYWSEEKSVNLTIKRKKQVAEQLVQHVKNFCKKQESTRMCISFDIQCPEAQNATYNIVYTGYSGDLEGLEEY